LLSKLRNIALLLTLLLSSSALFASHIVGGEITYVHLGGNTYRFTIDIYQDCKGGNQLAIQEDDPAYLGIYFNDGSGQRIRVDSTNPGVTISVPANFSNSCVNNAPDVCLKRIRFQYTYTLPPSPRGYIVVYQRCCRNAAILNLVNPGNIGVSYTCVVPPSSTSPVPNNSAVFKNYPPQIICLNVPLVYDHSATDVDGDSLSYEFCQAYAGGGPNDAKPIPEPPPYPPVSYPNPFSAVNPMGGNPRIQIDPRTGLITGMPTLPGRFVVAVCCHEWRNGVMINTVTREFQFEVTGCSKAVVANTPVFSDLPNTYIVNCRDKTVTFKNTSTGGFEWFWDFGVEGATSSEFEPTFTYPDTGTYLIKLVVNRGSTCPDSIERIVKIYPNFEGDFSISGLLCPGTPIIFHDLSTTTYGEVNYWSWDFGDNQFSGNQFTGNTYAQGGLYKVILYSGSSLGCRDTTIKEIDVDRFKPFAGNDTIIVAGEYINFNAQGGSEYTWTPSTNLDFTNVNNPTGRYPDTGHYRYNVYIKSSYGCEGNDSITVRVVNQASFFVPNAFTPNGDGRNDILRPRAVGYRSNEFFRVFNRFGEMVYESKDFNNGWDGTYKGAKSDLGTYFYMLKMINRFGQEETAKGDVILMR
jgi:gliding motility-associated-like protein